MLANLKQELKQKALDNTNAITKKQLSRKYFEVAHFEFERIQEWCEFLYSTIISKVFEDTGELLGDVEDRNAKENAGEAAAQVFQDTLHNAVDGKKGIFVAKSTGRNYDLEIMTPNGWGGVFNTGFGGALGGYEKELQGAKLNALNKIAGILVPDGSKRASMLGRKINRATMQRLLLNTGDRHHGSVIFSQRDMLNQEIANTTSSAMQAYDNLKNPPFLGTSTGKQIGTNKSELKKELLQQKESTQIVKGVFTNFAQLKLADLVATEIIWDRKPQNAQFMSGQGYRYREENTVEITFALSPVPRALGVEGTMGRAYRNFMREYEAGTGGGLGAKLDLVLANLYDEIIKDLGDNFFGTRDYPVLLGSASIVDHLGAASAEIVAKELTKTVKSQGKGKVKVKKQTKYSKRSNVEKRKIKVGTPVRKAKPKTKKAKKLKIPEITTIALTQRNRKPKEKTEVEKNNIKMVNLINRKLGREVAENMGSPRLNFRTGRFANSARVKRVMGKRIFYTYMKFPYQTFEPGFAQGSIQRDPRAIIGMSIRDIARQQMTSRFLTFRE